MMQRPLLTGTSLTSSFKIFALNQIVEVLRKLVSINSVSGNEKRISDYLAGILEGLGFDVRRLGNSMVAERGSSPVVFVGHLDTLPPRMGISGDPFRMRTVGRRAYGLGIFHMKSGIASFISLAEHDIPLRIVLSSGNRINDMWEMLHSGVFRGAEFAISLHGSEFGPRSITMGRMGKCVLKMTIVNRKQNPIHDAVSILREVSNDSVSFHPNLGFSVIEPIRLETITKGRDEPEKVLIDFKRTLVPGETVTTSIEEIKSKIRKMDIESAVKLTKKKNTVVVPPFETSPGNRYVSALSEAIKQKFRSVSHFYEKEPCIDNIVSYIIPVVSFGPRGGFEGTNEWADLRSISQTVDVLKSFHEIAGIS